MAAYTECLGGKISARGNALYLSELSGKPEDIARFMEVMKQYGELNGVEIKTDNDFDPNDPNGEGKGRIVPRPFDADIDNRVPEWDLSFTESDKKDDIGRNFILSPNNSIDFGFIKSGLEIPSAPIRLSKGDRKSGYLHINWRHGKQIKKAGFESIEDFVAQVSQNHTRIIEKGNSISGSTYLVQLQDRYNDTLYIELSKEGDYWKVISGGRFKKNYGNKFKEVWSASEVQNSDSAIGVNGSQLKPNAEKGSTSNGAPSNTSADKGTNNSIESQVSDADYSLVRKDEEYAKAVEAGDDEAVQRLLGGAARPRTTLTLTTPPLQAVVAAEWEMWIIAFSMEITQRYSLLIKRTLINR